MPEPTVIDSTGAGVLLWDGDGLNLPDPGVQLEYQPAGSTLGNSSPNASVLFHLDLGVLAQGVHVCIPPVDVLAWADAIRAGGVS